LGGEFPFYPFTFQLAGSGEQIAD